MDMIKNISNNLFKKRDVNTIHHEITGVTHSSHPQHVLRWLQSNAPYICNGCNDFGFGPRFSCPNIGCNFNVHGDCCETIPQNHVTRHPFLRGNFVLSRKGYQVRCNACDDDIKSGSENYCCNNPMQNLHRSCASLPSKIATIIKNKEVSMTLKERNDHHTTCSYEGCPRVMGGWSYVSSFGRTSLHVKCWKHIEEKKLNPVII
ncbi:hypothetical protein COLO4_15015 [Corchorus olitorius]|uniref:Uncharacterized protein n=1 Tax=Corchorus olitorius TaxID=93759 RepID=A0A1R3JPW0_9ROSI|nr:hypothetical protein COLO4_15015 [Corchorus olitorius]